MAEEVKVLASVCWTRRPRRPGVGNYCPRRSTSTASTAACGMLNGTLPLEQEPCLALVWVSQSAVLSPLRSSTLPSRAACPGMALGSPCPRASRVSRGVRGWIHGQDATGSMQRRASSARPRAKGMGPPA